jgi:hypothetical protein
MKFKDLDLEVIVKSGEVVVNAKTPFIRVNVHMPAPPEGAGDGALVDDLFWERLAKVTQGIAQGCVEASRVGECPGFVGTMVPGSVPIQSETPYPPPPPIGDWPVMGPLGSLGSL